MIRKVIQIDEEKCDGCGICANACHEGAIAIVNGRARLVRDDYCDGMGDCLPACPQGAIEFVEREAAAYDAEAVKAHMARRAEAAIPTGHRGHGHPGGCPGAMARSIDRPKAAVADTANASAGQAVETTVSQLRNWPVQIKLAPTAAPYFQGAHLLVAADCSAYAYAAFHRDFIAGKVCLIGCPKLDAVDYSEKLAAILAGNDITAVTLTRMEVPCCGGLQRMLENALQLCGKQIPYSVTTFSLDGRIL